MNSTLTNVAKVENPSSAQFAARFLHDRRSYDNIWFYTREAKGLDLNVTTVEEHSDIAVTWEIMREYTLVSNEPAFSE